MTKKMWEFRVDGVRHKVEIEHGYMSRKLSAVIDGGSKPIQFPKNQEPFDLGSKNQFQLANHTCAVVIIPYAFKYEYDLEVDGVSIVTGKSNDMQEIRSRQLKTASRQAGIFILLMGLILGWVNWNLVHTKGYFYEEVAYFTPFFIFLPIYFMLFPKEFVDQYEHKQKLSAKMWIVVIIFMLLGFAHAYLLGHGLY
jgi:hypothetical protein